jgi:hypothetical protein
LVLMLALVSTVAIGSGFAAWWAVRRHREITAATAVRRRNLDACSASKFKSHKTVKY